MVEFVAGAMTLAAAIILVLVTGGFLLWRHARRRWRRFRSHGLVVGAVALWEATASIRLARRHPSPRSAAELAALSPRALRGALWRSLDDADAAIATADEVGAPTASLPALVRRLRAAVGDLDRVLRLEPSGTVPDAVRIQAADLLGTASEIRRAAMDSASDASAARVADVVRDSGHEVACLDAGLASVRSVLPVRRA